MNLEWARVIPDNLYSPLDHIIDEYRSTSWLLPTSYLKEFVKLSKIMLFRDVRRTYNILILTKQYLNLRMQLVSK